MKPVFDRNRVLVYAGQEAARSDVLAAARAHLIAAGAHHLDVDDALVDQPGLVLRAWWGGEGVGFVGEEHPDAQPVTVVNIPGGLS